MALTKKLEKDNNEYKLDFENTYFKIDTLFFDLIDDEGKIGVRGYPDEYSRKNNGIGIFKKLYDIKFSDLKVTKFEKDIIISSAYKYLKDLDEFKDAKDC